MIIIEKEQVFIKLESYYTTTTDTSIYLRDLGDIFCKNPNTQYFLENLKILKTKEENWACISSVDIVNKIQSSKDNIDVTMIGEPEILIEIKDREKRSQLFQSLKVIFICIILFLGAGVAIVNFYEDVGIKKSMEKLFYIVTGSRNNSPLILVIPFSIGIGIGIIMFFSRMLTKNKRRKKEPGPMEVEMLNYNKEIEDYIIEDLKSEKD